MTTSDTAPRQGVLPDTAIRTMIEEGAITLGASLTATQEQPASLDLTLGARAYRVRASFLPSPQQTVRERLDDGLIMHEIDLRDGAVFERGCVYIVELREALSLPANISAAANPKSSTGRIDVFVRLVADRAPAFDAVPAGYRGPLYAEISPRTFSIIARTGSSLNQLRFKQGQPRLTDDKLEQLAATRPLIDAAADIDHGLGIRIDLKGDETGLIGWRARRHAGLIDVDEKAALDPFDFFEPVRPRGHHRIILDPDVFYILVSKERLQIPPAYAAEMTPITTGLGEFRVHYAGFFDPGFGWQDGANPTSRAVLEVRSHDAPFLLDDGQLVARLVYEDMLTLPQNLYGGAKASNYQGQSLRLSKHFKEPVL